LCVEERWPGIARGYVLVREPDGSIPSGKLFNDTTLLDMLDGGGGGGERGEGGIQSTQTYI